MKTHTTSLQCELCPTILKNVLTASNHSANTKMVNMDLVGPHIVAKIIIGNPDVPDMSRSALLVAKLKMKKEKEVSVPLI